MREDTILFSNPAIFSYIKKIWKLFLTFVLFFIVNQIYLRL